MIFNVQDKQTNPDISVNITKFSIKRIYWVSLKRALQVNLCFFLNIEKCCVPVTGRYHNDHNQRTE